MSFPKAGDVDSEIEMVLEGSEGSECVNNANAIQILNQVIFTLQILELLSIGFQRVLP